MFKFCGQRGASLKPASDGRGPLDVLHRTRRHPEDSISLHEKFSSGQLLAFTVKIATQTVARMKPLDDLYSNNQGFLRASLSILSISPDMI